MKLLALECSAAPASAAVLEDGEIVASAFVNVKQTHSRTLLPMVEAMLRDADLTMSDIGGIAVSAGPGSFTGVRIGISAAKGLAAPGDLPCAGVSTLLAMAHNISLEGALVCAVMDARCEQVYNALFEIQNGRVARLCEDRALSCKDLAENVKKMSQNGTKRVIIVGDGCKVFLPYVQDLPGTALAPVRDRFQNAVSVGLAATPMFESGQAVPPERLLPIYLRLPQAERELKKRNEKNAQVLEGKTV